jgi:DNA-binding PadR family transcriptional regulator
MSEQLILEALGVYRDRSAAQLVELTGLGAGSLYPALLSLEASGAIESRWFNEEGAWPRRRVYRLPEAASQKHDA